MRIHRFYIGNNLPNKETITIDDADLIHQWKNVFRMKIGTEMVLFGDDKVEYTSRLITLEKKLAVFEVVEKAEGKIADRDITLCAALIKKDNFEIIIQKAVEIGVTKIIPVISDRSEKKFLNKERARKIIIEACEQCGRVDIPTLEDTVSFNNAISISSDTKIIGFEPKGAPFDTKVFSNNKLALFIGPEGGWTDEEIEVLKKNGVLMNLPTFILRAETAAIVALSLAKILS